MNERRTATVFIKFIHERRKTGPHKGEYESVVSPVSKRYMRAGIGNDRLLVCLSTPCQ